MAKPSFWKLHWHIADPEEPSLVFYEVQEVWVSRAVELFDTGVLRWCDGPDELGGARFPDQPWSAADVAERAGAAGEFHLTPIQEAHFERVWRAATETR